MPYFYPLVKQKAVKLSDFLGSIGGLMGLFVGASVFSLFEFTFDFLLHVKNKIAARMPRSKVRVIIVKSKVEAGSEKIITVNRKHMFYKCAKLLRHFAKESSIHGVPHIVNKDQKKLEKIFWIFTVAVSVAMCTNLILDTIDQADMNPIEYGIDDKLWSLKDVSCF